MTAGPPSLVSKLLGEFVGTFLLIFTVGCNVLSGNSVWGGVSIASVLMVCIYKLGGISGANFNPAVSFALTLVKAIGQKDGKGLAVGEMAMYMGTQLAAGVCAAFGYTMLFHKSFELGPAEGFSAVHAGLSEMLYTFVLCFVVLNTAVGNGTHGNEFFGLAIGFVIVAGAYGAGGISGGCFNPAVAVGIDVSHAGIGARWSLFYMLCEFVGSALAAVAFRVVRPEDFNGGAKSAASAYVSEFLGTFVLVLTVGLNVLGKSPAGAFSIAASLMSMIYALGDVSGANFNPAVTVTILASGKAGDMTPAKAGIYILCQLAGGISAAFTYSFMRKGASFALAPGAHFGLGEAAVGEITFTFVLCYCVLGVAVSETTKAKTMFGLAIGACVTVGGNAIGAISGGSLNPAVSFGIATSHLPAGGSILNAVYYTGFELAGALLAAGAFRATHAAELQADDKHFELRSLLPS